MSSYNAGIRFNDCVFSEPVRFSEWFPPTCGGIVAVLAHDPNWGPRPFRPLYFGEFGNDSRRFPGNAPFLIAVCAMPYSTSAQRRTLCDELIAGYNPLYQTKGNIGKLFAAQPAGPRRPIGFMPDILPVTETGS